ncbi:GHKL domain-containing protein [Mediterraneibacter faecis]|uniref:GHKL domain-containing protein n=1 Tax=Mediterraneibacter faecis TaxID=592978 RepID=UPI003B50E80B
MAQNTNIFNKVSALNLSTTHTQKNNTIEDVQNHGLGLKSVSRIISNYNGTIKMYYDSSQKVFHTIILLNNA